MAISFIQYLKEATGPGPTSKPIGPASITLKADFLKSDKHTGNPWVPSTAALEKSLEAKYPSLLNRKARKGLTLKATGAFYSNNDIEYKNRDIEMSFTPEELKKYSADGLIDLEAAGSDLDHQITTICNEINKSKDFDGLKIKISRNRSTTPGPNNLAGRSTITFDFELDFDAFKDYTEKHEKFYKMSVEEVIDKPKVHFWFERIGEDKMYAELKKVYAYFEKRLKDYKVAWSYQRAFGQEKSKYVITASAQALLE